MSSKSGYEYVNGEYGEPRRNSQSLKGRESISLERAAAGIVDVDAKATGYVILSCIVRTSLLDRIQLQLQLLMPCLLLCQYFRICSIRPRYSMLA